MRDEGIDELFVLTVQAVLSLRQAIYKELPADNEIEDDIKPIVKAMMIKLTRQTICNQITHILGIHMDSEKEFADMRAKLDAKITYFIYDQLSMDDLLKFIKNLYAEVISIESKRSMNSIPR